MRIAKRHQESTRAERKAKKRKLEVALPDLPGEIGVAELQDIPIPAAEHNGKYSKKWKRDKHDIDSAAKDSFTEQAVKKGRKRKEEGRTQQDGEINASSIGMSSGAGRIELKELKKLKGADGEVKLVGKTSNDSSILLAEVQPQKKSNKERKAERKAAEAAQASASSDATSVPMQDAHVASEEGVKAGKSRRNNRETVRKWKGIKSNVTTTNGTEPPEKTEGKAPRFIVFIGNLPFTATTESIQKHFAAVHPKYVRHLTKKDEPTKSKGCAFVELDGYDHMKACLKSFHHSVFDDGISLPRKINVELTAGGGGNKKNRHDKIDEKNQKLNEERIRRIHEKANLVKKDAGIDHNDVHQSRRGRVSGAS